MKVENLVKKGVVILAAALLSASSAYAANVETMGIGTMNTGQAGAVSAYCDNVFASYYNPAGLSLLAKPTLTVSTMVYDAQIKVYDWEVKTSLPAQDNPNIAKGPVDYESDKMVVASPSMGFAMPVSDKVTLGVAAYTPYGLHVTWDKDPAKSPSSAYAWESYYGRVAVSPTLSYKVSDKLAVGVGVSLGRSISEAGKTNEIDDRLKTPTAQNMALVSGLLAAAGKDSSAASVKAYMGKAFMLDGSQMKMEATDDFNYSFNVGVMYRPIEQLSFGLTYRGRADGDFEGDVKVKNATVMKDDASGFELRDLDGSVTMKYDHPEQVQAGVRWFASNKLSVEADVTWTGWSVNENQDESAVIKDVPVFVAGVGVVKVDTPMEFKHARNWEDTTSYRLGVSYKATDAVVLRAGYAYDPSPVPDETFEFGWPDTDRNMYSLGAGWRINERWMLDAVLQHIISTEKRATKGSEELDPNYVLAYGGPATVYCKDVGVLWGAGLTLTYTF